MRVFFKTSENIPFEKHWLNMRVSGVIKYCLNFVMKEQSILVIPVAVIFQSHNDFSYIRFVNIDGAKVCEIALRQ